MNLQIEKISKQYGKTVVLSDVSFELNPGVTALLGNNGAGKTTLLSIMTGLLDADDGVIKLDGEAINVKGKRYKERLGFLPQECGFYNNFSAIEFIRYMGSLKGVNNRVCDDRIEKYMNILSLWENRNMKIHKYSGGMKRRLGIVQAIINQPKLLILDEPTTGLDYDERSAFKNMINEYSEDNNVLIATHIFTDVDGIANKVVIMKNGHIVCDGNLDESETVEQFYIKNMMEK